MEKELLDKANQLFRLIFENKEKSDSLAIQIFAIENPCGREYGSFKLPKRTIEHYTKIGWSEKTEKTEIKEIIIEDDIVLKILKHQKYITDNMIKKYEYDFNNL